jgi:hypothetical protein
MQAYRDGNVTCYGLEGGGLIHDRRRGFLYVIISHKRLVSNGRERLFASRNWPRCESHQCIDGATVIFNDFVVNVTFKLIIYGLKIVT